MLEGLSNTTTQTCCPLCDHKKLNKLDDRKKFQFLKRGRGIKSEKCANKLEIKKVWKQVKDGAQ